MDDSGGRKIGRVLSADNAQFIVGCQVLQTDVPRFGEMVKVVLEGAPAIFGLIQNVQVPDDTFVRQLVMAGTEDATAIADHRLNRLVPIEIRVLAVGYVQGRAYLQGLPPQPPLALVALEPCTPEDVRRFIRDKDNRWRFDYFRLISDGDKLSDELLTAHIRYLTEILPPEERLDMAVAAGKALALLFSRDILRLEVILRRIEPRE